MAELALVCECGEATRFMVEVFDGKGGSVKHYLCVRCVGVVAARCASNGAGSIQAHPITDSERRHWELRNRAIAKLTPEEAEALGIVNGGAK